jgi:hypothetical protein
LASSIFASHLRGANKLVGGSFPPNPLEDQVLLSALQPRKISLGRRPFSLYFSSTFCAQFSQICWPQKKKSPLRILHSEGELFYLFKSFNPRIMGTGFLVFGIPFIQNSTKGIFDY